MIDWKQEEAKAQAELQLCQTQLMNWQARGSKAAGVLEFVQGKLAEVAADDAGTPPAKSKKKG